MKPGLVVRSALVALGLSIVSLSSALAANAPREHDGGLFLRLSAGGGTAQTKMTDVLIAGQTSDLEYTGTAGDFNFAIGGIVSPNLALHGTLAGWGINEPDQKHAGHTVRVHNFDMTMAMVGGGVTYYFMPANIYLSGSVGAARMRFSAPDFGVEENSDTGVAVDLTAGKEWWVGSKWGLGVAAGVNMHSIPSGSTVPEFQDKDFKGTSFALRFSATMN